MVESTSAEGLITRLRRIEGQVRGLQRMLEQGRECEDVLTQVMAVRSSIDQVGLLLMDRHIDTCLLGSQDAEAGLRNLQRALRMWLRFGVPSSPDEKSARPSTRVPGHRARALARDPLPDGEPRAYPREPLRGPLAKSS